MSSQPTDESELVRRMLAGDERAFARVLAAALRAVLSGSTAGLTPAEALAAVLPTTQLRSSREQGKILIRLQ